MNGTTEPTSSLDTVPGLQTSEGRLTLGASVAGVLVLVITIIHPGFKIDAETKRDIATLLSLALPAMIASYQHARARVKVAVTQAKAQQVQQLMYAQRTALAGTATAVAREDMQHHHG